MKTWLTITITLALTTSLPVQADDGSDFVAAFGKAVNSQQRAPWEAFLSPASRVCLAGPGREMLEQIFANDTRTPVPAQSKVWVTPIGAKEVLMGEGMLAYPDRPTHYFQIDLGPPGRATRSLVRYGRKQDGRWQYVLGCPTADGIAQAKVAQKERAVAETEARRRAASLPPAVLAEAKRLLAEGHDIDATRTIAKATGLDLSTAHGIVRVLAEQAKGR